MDLETVFCHQMIEQDFNIDNCILYFENQCNNSDHQKWLNSVDMVLYNLQQEKSFYVSNILVHNNFTETDINDFKNKLKQEEFRILKRIKFIYDVEASHTEDESLR